jgi:hypothetical protein
MLSLGTSTSLLRGGHENTVCDTNCESNYLQLSKNQLTFGEPSQTTIMFNIWSDLRMPKS